MQVKLESLSRVWFRGRSGGPRMYCTRSTSANVTWRCHAKILYGRMRVRAFSQYPRTVNLGCSSEIERSILPCISLCRGDCKRPNPVSCSLYQKHAFIVAASYFQKHASTNFHSHHCGSVCYSCTSEMLRLGSQMG